MFLDNLIKTTTKSNKRLGRGYGSGKGGHTSSRGQKGQKSRTKVGILFEGTKSNKDFFRQVPMLRGKSKLKSHQKDTVVIKLSALAVFKDGETVDEQALLKHKLATEREIKSFGVKVLFDKAIDKKLIIKVPASKAVLKSQE